LIELGCIDLDDLSRALGQQHGVPAALARHFDKANPELQARLPADIARELSVVPLVRLSPQRLAVVALDPLASSELELLAQLSEVGPDAGTVSSVAAALRVLCRLERVYTIPRPPRYLRSRGASITPFPQFDDFEIEVDSDVDMAIPSVADESRPPS